MSVSFSFPENAIGSDGEWRNNNNNSNTIDFKQQLMHRAGRTHAHFGRTEIHIVVYTFEMRNQIRERANEQ